MALDLTKPLYTKSGNRVELFGILPESRTLIGGYRLVVITDPGNDLAREIATYTLDGRFTVFAPESGLDLTNEPERIRKA